MSVTSWQYVQAQVFHTIFRHMMTIVHNQTTVNIVIDKRNVINQGTIATILEKMAKEE
jgi:hypothetical protein